MSSLQETHRTPCTVSIVRNADHWSGRFVAMACPCDVLIEARTVAEQQARAMIEAVAQCAWRIERKFSRYRPGSSVHRINESHGRELAVDAETANLLDFAATLTQLSEGRFDITSGVLRKAWTFDGGSDVPTQQRIDALLPLVGWHKVHWDRSQFRLRMLPGMQLDFGGIGKEYAVDAAAAAAEAIGPGVSTLVNFGGDIAVRSARSDGRPWQVGIEKADRVGQAAELVPLMRGGLATSGDSRRFVFRDGHRYSHILDARTGWPVAGAPRSITVAADTCTQAGSLTTLAMLRGADAESTLREAAVRYWLQ